MGRLVAWKAVDTTLQALHHALRRHPSPTGGRRRWRGAPTARGARRRSPAGGRRAVSRLPTPGCLRRDPAPCRRPHLELALRVWRCRRARSHEHGTPGDRPRLGGPADYLDETCGILVHPSPRETYAARIAEAIGALAEDPDRRVRLGRAGAARVRQDFDWATKVEQMVSIYRSVLDQQAHLGGSDEIDRDLHDTSDR